MMIISDTPGVVRAGAGRREGFGGPGPARRRQLQFVGGLARGASAVSGRTRGSNSQENTLSLALSSLGC